MRRRVPPLVAVLVAVVAVIGVGACGSDEPSAGTGTTVAPGGSTSTSGADGPGTTADLDGREPDAVEAPPADEVPVTARPPSPSTRAVLPGFGEVVIEVRQVDGDTVEWCVLLAETAAQTQRGLMEVTDPELGGYDGMLFRFEDSHEGGFYMRNTPQELDIAYLDDDGAIVSTATMAPCEDVDGCPTYPADGAFRRTVEVPVEAGGLARLGIEGDAVVVDTGRTCAS
jgi:uncharacterized membrane protein (UPF0127 family)